MARVAGSAAPPALRISGVTEAASAPISWLHGPACVGSHVALPFRKVSHKRRRPLQILRAKAKRREGQRFSMAFCCGVFVISQAASWQMNCGQVDIACERDGRISVSSRVPDSRRAEKGMESGPDLLDSA